MLQSFVGNHIYKFLYCEYQLIQSFFMLNEKSDAHTIYEALYSNNLDISSVVNVLSTYGIIYIII